MVESKHVTAVCPQGAIRWLVDRLLTRGRASAYQRRMELVETLSIGGKRQLILVTCDEERFLIVASSEGVQVIKSLGREADKGLDTVKQDNP